MTSHISLYKPGIFHVIERALNDDQGQVLLKVWYNHGEKQSSNLLKRVLLKTERWETIQQTVIKIEQNLPWWMPGTWTLEIQGTFMHLDATKSLPQLEINVLDNVPDIRYTDI